MADKCMALDTMTGNLIQAGKKCYIHVKVRYMEQEICTVLCHELYRTVGIINNSS